MVLSGANKLFKVIFGKMFGVISRVLTCMSTHKLKNVHLYVTAPICPDLKPDPRPVTRPQNL